MVVAQLDAIARHAPAISVATVLVGVVLATWSGMRGARGLMSALNDVYGERERRSFWHREALALALTLLGGAFLLAALVLIVGLAGSSGEHTRPATTALLAPSRWPVLIVAMVLLLAVSYRYAPCHRAPKWRWVTWGASVSATIWVLVSFAFSYFAAHFTHVNPLLGSLGSVVMFLFWCYLTVLVVLLGAHINAQLEEHRTTDATARKASGAHEASLARKPPAAARRKATRRTRRH